MLPVRKGIIYLIFRVSYRLGMPGIPVYNTNNNGATGSSTVHLAYNLVRGGIYNCLIAVGF
jgi:acetyl-CoA acetyltransferase